MLALTFMKTPPESATFLIPVWRMQLCTHWVRNSSKNNCSPPQMWSKRWRSMMALIVSVAT